ncbi:MAG: hypothetical protein ACR2P5_09285, partial [Gammaproteobacteria bacterium]
MAYLSDNQNARTSLNGLKQGSQGNAAAVENKALTAWNVRTFYERGDIVYLNNAGNNNLTVWICTIADPRTLSINGPAQEPSDTATNWTRILHEDSNDITTLSGSNETDNSTLYKVIEYTHNGATTKFRLPNQVVPTHTNNELTALEIEGTSYTITHTVDTDTKTVIATGDRSGDVFPSALTVTTEDVDGNQVGDIETINLPNQVTPVGTTEALTGLVIDGTTYTIEQPDVPVNHSNTISEWNSAIEYTSNHIVYTNIPVANTNPIQYRTLIFRANATNTNIPPVIVNGEAVVFNTGMWTEILVDTITDVVAVDHLNNPVSGETVVGDALLVTEHVEHQPAVINKIKLPNQVTATDLSARTSDGVPIRALGALTINGTTYQVGQYFAGLTQLGQETAHRRAAEATINNRLDHDVV